MAVIIEASIKGNIGQPSPNVVSGGDKVDPQRRASGFTKVISDNNAKVAGKKSANVRAIQPTDSRETMEVLRTNARDATKGFSEFNKGLNFSAHL